MMVAAGYCPWIADAQARIENVVAPRNRPAPAHAHAAAAAALGLEGVLLWHKRGLAFARRQHGHQGSTVSKAAAIGCRKVVMDDGTWRCARWTSPSSVVRG
jgi:hypothetical protein